MACKRSWHYHLNKLINGKRLRRRKTVNIIDASKEQQVERIRHYYNFGTQGINAIINKLRVNDGIIVERHLVVIIINRIVSEKEHIKEQRRGKSYGKYLPHKVTAATNDVPTFARKVCPVCLKPPTKFSGHHMIPKSQKGVDEPRNMIYTCKHCHDILEEYADKEIYYSPELARKIRLILLKEIL